MATFTVAVPYHCIKCRSVSLHTTFDSLAELRDHVVKIHFNSETADVKSFLNGTVKKSISQEDLTSRRVTHYDDLLVGSSIDNQKMQKVKDLKKQVEEERIARRKRMKEIEERDQNISGRKQIHIVPSVKDGAEDNEENKTSNLRNLESIHKNEDMKKGLIYKIENLFRKNQLAEDEVKIFEKYKRDTEATAKLKMVEDVVSSCEVASDVVVEHYKATDPNFISKLLAPSSSMPDHTVLSQIYVHAFNAHYSKLQH